MTRIDDKAARDAALVNYDSVARVSSAVQLQDVGLRASRSALGIAVEEVPGQWATDAFVGFDTVAHPWEPEKGEFKIQAAFLAVYKTTWGNEVLAELPEFDPDDPPDIEIQASFELTYTAPPPSEFDPDDLQSFALANGTLHAWPYWREFADSMVQRMQLPRLVIGVFKMPSSHDPSDDPPADSGTA
jgi:hypothetical protein